MNKYNEGKIYKLINPDLPNIIYIGSTIRTLKERLIGHKCSSKKINMSSKILFSVGEPEIILLEAYPCECRKELMMKEQEYINNIGCINKNNSFITDEEKKEHFKEYDKEYRQLNKKNINQKAKENYHKNKEYYQKYYQKNKEIIYEKHKEKITCECGSIIRKVDKSQHEKSKKHINYIKICYKN